MSAARKGGASAHITAITTRRPERTVTRVAANQPPSTASGSAMSHSTSSEKEGFAGQSDPSTATTAENGSAAETTSSPIARCP
jgi:hypothetical protein